MHSRHKNISEYILFGGIDKFDRICKEQTILFENKLNIKNSKILSIPEKVYCPDRFYFDQRFYIN
jgi:hypothetical protein